jgi:hypothetical protein
LSGIAGPAWTTILTSLRFAVALLTSGSNSDRRANDEKEGTIKIYLFLLVLLLISPALAQAPALFMDDTESAALFGGAVQVAGCEIGSRWNCTQVTENHSRRQK